MSGALPPDTSRATSSSTAPPDEHHLRPASTRDSGQNEIGALHKEGAFTLTELAVTQRRRSLDEGVLRLVSGSLKTPSDSPASGRFERGASLTDERGEMPRVGHGELGQDLAVELDLGQLAGRG